MPIVQGVRLEDLAAGVGHYPATALPGRIGNFAVAGHRATNGEPFAALDQVRAGDAVVVETMSAIEECCTAVRAVRERTNLTVVASFTFSPRHGGGYASMMGVSPTQFAEAVLAAGAHVIGANCGLGPDMMVDIVRELRAAVPGAPLLAMPNAGMPALVDGRTVFRETPDDLARKAVVLREAGASLIGGCCGTTPDHIRAMARALRTPRAPA